MKKTPVINTRISSVISDMGHMDLLAVGDAGTPVPKGTEKIDLAVANGIPTFLQVLDNILKELKVQKVYVAEEIKEKNPKQLIEIKKRFTNIELVFISHDELKFKLKDSKAFIRTGEMTPYSNVILEGGVIF
ncbi:D-ribose pyranase [Ligilactobacillus agilis]|uniref:D-ribose pyranase n=1 Tax=Ligilactobacillus agilis TaxID=1601 RepID=UPI003F8BBD6E